MHQLYLMVALAPLAVGSLAALLLLAVPLPGWGASMIALGAVVNFAGAVGDLWIAWIVFRYPEQVVVVDERDGMRVFLPG